jgi:hypothetical protein
VQPELRCPIRRGGDQVNRRIRIRPEGGKTYLTPERIRGMLGKVIEEDDLMALIALDDEGADAYGHRTYLAFKDEIEEVK